MRLLKSLLAFASLLLGTATAQAQILPRAVGEWEATAGFRALERPATTQDNVPIFVNPETGATLLDSDTLTDLNIGVGADFSFSTLREDGLDYEMRFFFNSFERNTITQSEFIANTFDDLTDPDAGPFAQEVLGNYTSDLISIELNQKRIFGPYVRLLHGVRFLNIAEKLSFRSRGSVLGAPLLPPISFSTIDVTKTKNPMLGYQVGAESKITLIPGLDMDAYFKAGMYNNFASQESVSTVTGGIPGTTLFSDSTVFNSSENVMGFVSDFGVKFQFQIVENFMSFYGGYDGMFVNSFAPAPMNTIAGITDPDDLPIGMVNDMNFWLHGITFGISVKR